MPKTQIQINTQFQGTGAGDAAVALGKVGATASKAERELLAYAGAVAKAQRTQGDAAGAVKTYENALAQVDRTSRQAIATEGQLAASIAQVQRQAQSAPILPRTVESFGTQAIDQFKSGLLGIVGPAAIASAAIAAIPAALNLAQSSAKIDATRQSFDNLAKSVNTTGDTLLTKLHAAAQGTVSDAALIQAANSGLLLTQGKIAGDLPRILEIARAAAQATGDDVDFVFNSLVTGIARGSPKVIDNAKITLDASAAFETYAKSIGKSADQLTAAEQQQATLNAVLVAGTQLIASAGPAADTDAAAFARFGATIENIKNSTGSFLAGGLRPLVTEFNQTTNAVAGLSAWYQQLGVQTSAQQNASAAYDAELKKSGDMVLAQAAYERALAEASALSAIGVLKSADADDRRAAAALAAIPAIDARTDAERRLANATGLADQRKGEQTGTDLSAAQFDKFSNLARGGAAEAAAEKKRVDEAAAKDAATLQDVQFNNQLKKAKDNVAKIALLRGRESGADPIEKARIEGQIIDLQSQKVAGLSKEKNLQESIYDSVNKQVQAAIDLRQARAQGALDTLKENRELKTAQAILNSPNANAEFKQTAQAKIDLIGANRAERALKEKELTASAGGSISASGKLLQSVPSAGGPVASAAPVGATGGALNAPQPAAAAAGGSTMTVNVIVDGKAAWSGMAPYAWDEFVHAARVQ